MLTAIGAFGTVTKRFVQGLDDWGKRGRVDTIPAIVEIGQNTKRFEETCFHSDSGEKPPSNASMKNSQISKITTSRTG